MTVLWMVREQDLYAEINAGKVQRLRKCEAALDPDTM